MAIIEVKTQEYWRHGQVPEVGRHIHWKSIRKNHLNEDQPAVECILMDVFVKDNKMAEQFKSVYWVYSDECYLPEVPWPDLDLCPYCGKIAIYKTKNLQHAIACKESCGYHSAWYQDKRSAALAHNAVCAEYRNRGDDENTV